MAQPSPDDFLYRLRAIYCRHKGMSYETYDRLVEEERIPFAELRDLVEVLFTEIQHAGLAEYLFREEAMEEKRKKERLTEISKVMERIGHMRRACPAMADRYNGQIEALKEEARNIRRSLGAET